MGAAYLSNRGFILNGGGGSSVLISKDITENGIYNATEDSADGYSSVSVNVNNSDIELDEKTITVNGEYNASDDELDGYSKVTVNVPTTGLSLNYVDGNMGYISLNKFTNRNIRIHIPEFPYNIPNGSDITFEYCLCFDSGRTHPGRYHQISAGFLLCDDVVDNKYYLDLSFDSGVTWAIDSDHELIEIPQDRDVTLTLRIDTAKTDIFIDGEFYVQTASANSTMLPHLTVNETRFMYGTTSNREVNGKFYAARFYNRALTDAEIMHNHEQDVKLIAFINA